MARPGVFNLLSCPRQHGKTTFFSWAMLQVLGIDPLTPIGFISYNETKARKVSGATRELAEEYPQLGLQVHPKYNADREWFLRDPSSRIGARAGGITASGPTSVVGRDFRCLIYDDPHRGFLDAMSPGQKEKIWETFLSDVLGCLHEDSIVWIVHTRWAEDDLIGRILRAFPEQCIYHRLPAISEGEGDVLGRPEGAALCPEIASAEFLLRRAPGGRNSIGAKLWSYMYQQDERGGEGDVFPFTIWNLYTAAPPMTEYAEVFAVSDFASAGLDQAKGLPDYTVHGLFGVTPVGSPYNLLPDGTLDEDRAHLWALDMIRNRVDFSENSGIIRALLNSHMCKGASCAHPVLGADGVVQPCKQFCSIASQRVVRYLRSLSSFRWRHVNRWDFEAASNAYAMHSALRKAAGGLFNLIPAAGSKEVRGAVVRPYALQGRIHLPDPGQIGVPGWVGRFVIEAQQFPNGANDDMVDVLIHAALRSLGRDSGGVIEAPELIEGGPQTFGARWS